MLDRPTAVDPEVAELTFNEHLDELWRSGLPATHGWGRIPLNKLHTVIVLWADRGGAKEHYFIRLGGEYYDRWPPSVSFVEPSEWQPVKANCRWWPAVNCPSWLGLHINHALNGNPGQLICFSFTAEYYMVDHNPGESAVWTPGVHTLSATLCRLQEALSPPYYHGPSA